MTMNITQLMAENWSYLSQEQMITMSNCIEYTEGLRSQIKAMGILLIIFAIYMTVKEFLDAKRKNGGGRPSAD
jgi:hypothetical protein